MSLPYLGSKQGIAEHIYRYIKNKHPKEKILVDPFCGGFAVSEYFRQRNYEVHANDKNKYIIALLDKLINNRLPAKEVNKFVTREEFNRVIKNPDNYEDWYVGYISVVWSFGNTGRNYIYGKKAYDKKMALHNLVVAGDDSGVVSLGILPTSAAKMVANQINRHIRRRALRIALTKIKAPREIYRLEHLERLERLEQTLRGKTTLTSKDYRELEIPEGAIVYCDPPYSDTAGYVVGAFNSQEFWDWARQVGKTNPIYISEYTAPEDFKCVLEIDHRSALAVNSKKSVEKLFTYEPV